MKLYLSSRHWLDALTVLLEQHIKKLVIAAGTFLEKQLPETYPLKQEVYIEAYNNFLQHK